MSDDFVDSNLPLPETKVDAGPIPAGASTTRYDNAAFLNELTRDIGSLRTAILTGKVHGLRSNTSESVSPAGGVKYVSNAGVPMLSRNGAPFTNVLPPNTLFLKEYATGGLTLYGDNVHDDTPVFQALLTSIGRAAGASTVTVFVPRPAVAYLVTGLVYNGRSTCSIRFVGELGGTDGMVGSLIRYNGTTGGTIIHCTGATSCVFEDIDFDLNLNAKYGVHLDSDADGGGTTLAASQDNRFRRCGFFNVQQVTGALAIALGSATLVNTQSSEVRVQDCYFRGNNYLGTYSGGAVGNLTAGNCKNFWVQNSTFFCFGKAINVSGSGSALLGVTDNYFGECDTAINATSLTASIKRNAFETGASYVGSAQFAVLTTTSTQAGFSIEDNYVAIDCGAAAVGIKVTGPGGLKRNTLVNNHTSAAVFKVQASGLVLVSTDSSSIERGGLVSESNWFSNVPPARPYAPIYDTTGNHILADSYGCRTGGLMLKSWGDISIPLDSSGNPWHLNTCVGKPDEIRRFAMSDETGVGTIVVSGEPGATRHRIEVDFAKVAVGGAVTTYALIVGNIYPLWKVRDVLVQVLTPFAGATTVTCAVGPTGTAAGYLVASDVKAATNTEYGLTDAETGSLINRANAVKGGHIPSATANTSLKATFVTTGANVSALSAGKVRITMFVEVMD